MEQYEALRVSNRENSTFYIYLFIYLARNNTLKVTSVQVSTGDKKIVR